MPTIYKEVEIDADLSDFSDDDLRDELENRGIALPDTLMETVSQIYHKRRLGHDYQSELDKLIYEALGKIV